MDAEKTIKIDDKLVKFRCTSAVTRFYRMYFDSDMFLDMAKLTDAVTEQEEKNLSVYNMDHHLMTIFENAAYAMAKYADPDNVPDDINQWLDGFSMGGLYFSMKEIVSLWNVTQKSISKLKKKAGAPSTDR